MCGGECRVSQVNIPIQTVQPLVLLVLPLVYYSYSLSCLVLEVQKCMVVTAKVFVEMCFILLPLHTALNSVLTLVFVGPYRRAVCGMLRLCGWRWALLPRRGSPIQPRPSVIVQSETLQRLSAHYQRRMGSVVK